MLLAPFKRIANTVGCAGEPRRTVEIGQAAQRELAQSHRATDQPRRTVVVEYALGVFDAAAVDIAEKTGRTVEIGDTAVDQGADTGRATVLIPVAVCVIDARANEIRVGLFIKEAAITEHEKR